VSVFESKNADDVASTGVSLLSHPIFILDNKRYKERILLFLATAKCIQGERNKVTIEIELIVLSF